MTIKKLGHCCLLIKEGDLKILSDPGNFTIEATKEISGLNVILITHDHEDHLHLESLKTLLQNNSNVKILTQKTIQKILEDIGIKSELLLDKQKITVKNVSIEGCGEKHAVIHSFIPLSDNTGYIISEKFFYPGDALTKPSTPVEILALPVAGPWIKISEAVDYALEIKPRVCFPVHDGIMTGAAHRIPAQILPSQGIQFIIPEGEMNF